MANNRELAEFGKFVSVDNTTKNVGIATTVRITAGGLFVGAVQAIRPDGTWGGSTAGIQGAQGTGGVQGTTGTQGTTGAQGTTGTQGITGTQGATGTQGLTGAQGATGSQGTAGSTGTQGTTGTQGAGGLTTTNATTLNGYSSATSGANIVLRTDANGYIVHQNWINIGNGTGLYAPSGAYFYEDTTYGWFSRSRTSSSSIRLQTSDGTARGWWYSDSAANQGWLTTGGSWNVQVTNAGNFAFNSGYGSVATVYGCRAWVNFDGMGSIGANQTIRASGNVSSVYKYGTGGYAIFFTNAMPDTNYAVAGMGRDETDDFPGMAPYRRLSNTNSTTRHDVETWYNSDVYNCSQVDLMFFR